MGLCRWNTVFNQTSCIHDGHVSVFQEGMDTPQRTPNRPNAQFHAMLQCLYYKLLMPKKNETLTKKQDSVVGFHYSCGHLWAAPHREGDLALLAVVYTQTF